MAPPAPASSLPVLYAPPSPIWLRNGVSVLYLIMADGGHPLIVGMIEFDYFLN
jgi:hypothetical protein